MARHSNAARLFLDWYLSDLGQKAMADNLYLHSLKQGADPPPVGAQPLAEIKLLLPDDWEAFLKSRTEFAKELGQVHRPALSSAASKPPRRWLLITGAHPGFISTTEEAR